DLRPHGTFPTLELRICDLCPSREDGVALAALFTCLCRMLYRLRRLNQRWRTYDTFLLNENRWRAQRYGIDEGLIDFGRGEVVAFSDLLDELIELVEEDASALDCVAEIAHLRTILAHGTSARRQRARYEALRSEGMDDAAAFREIIDGLIYETQHGIDAAA
ncbi:MAG: carboxylate-amine ligase, partial [Pseudomonadota bacterium]